VHVEVPIASLLRRRLGSPDRSGPSSAADEQLAYYRAVADESQGGTKASLCVAEKCPSFKMNRPVTMVLFVLARIEVRHSA
jgi:hypothetical protein